MTRDRLLNLLAVLSLPALALSAATWAATAARPAHSLRLATPARGKARFLVVGPGGVYLVTQELSQPADGSWTADLTDGGGMALRAGNTTMSAAVPAPEFFGFGTRGPASITLIFGAASNVDIKCAVTYRAGGFPFWFLCLLSATAPSLWLYARHRRRRRAARRGLCPHCNYDLRATPHRCPECGAVPTPL